MTSAWDYRRFRNLYPEDSVSTFERARLELRDSKWVEVALHRKVTARSAAGRYIFVTVDDVVYVCRASWRIEGGRVSHIDLAHGRSVDYAGEVYFASRKKRGILRRWNNASGHYRPSPKYASQAKLPMEYFQAEDFGSPAQSGYSKYNPTLLL